MTSERITRRDLTHFLYRSYARDGLGQEDLDQIVVEAQQRNSACDITGCLHYEDGLFFQWLEGPRHRLELIIALIRKDPRHSDMTDLSFGPASRRQFADWTMRVSGRSHGSLMDWVAAREVSTIDRGAYAGTVSAFLMSIGH